jgi:ABC-type transporter Mla subunit MlaD
MNHPVPPQSPLATSIWHAHYRIDALRATLRELDGVIVQLRDRVRTLEGSFQSQHAYLHDLEQTNEKYRRILDELAATHARGRKDLLRERGDPPGSDSPPPEVPE